MRTSDFIYYESLFWQRMREAGLKVEFAEPTNDLYALHTVVTQYTANVINDFIEFSDALAYAKEWHQNLIGA